MKKTYIVLALSLIGILTSIVWPPMSNFILLIYIAINLYINRLSPNKPGVGHSKVITKTKVLTVSNLKDLSIDNGSAFIRSLTIKLEANVGYLIRNGTYSYNPSGRIITDEFIRGLIIGCPPKTYIIKVINKPLTIQCFISNVDIDTYIILIYINKRPDKNYLGEVHEFLLGHYQGLMYKKNLAESESLRYVMLDNIPCGMYTKSYIEGFDYLSYGIKTITDYTYDQLIGSNDYIQLIHNGYKSLYLKSMEEALNNRVGVSIEYVIRDGKGKHRWVQDSCTYMVTKEGKGYLYGVIIDITDRALLAQSLKDREHILELEVARRTDELAKSNDDLKQFVYIASHDLQEPLRMINNYVQLLHMKYDSSLDEKAKAYMGFIIEGCQRMKSLIDDLLSYSRLNTNTQTFRVVDIRECVSKAMHNLEVAIHEAKADIHISSDMPRLYVMESLIIQVFQNLISNSLKFTRTIPRIDIDCHKSGEFWVFRIRDNGIGLDSTKYGARIFQPFQRLHNRQEYQGTGIGLAICKKIVERHGGSIWVESSPGNGCDTYFSIRERLDESTTS